MRHCRFVGRILRYIERVFKYDFAMRVSSGYIGADAEIGAGVAVALAARSHSSLRILACHWIGQTRWSTPYRNAVVSPKSNMPLRASSAPINSQCGVRYRSL